MLLTLEDITKDAKVTGRDDLRSIIFAHYGGHGIHGYEYWGACPERPYFRERYFWNLAATGSDSAPLEDVEREIRYQIQTGEYLETYDCIGDE